MDKRKYSGGLSSYQIWLPEFEQFVNLYLNGEDIKDIQIKGREENLFKQKTRAQAQRCSNNLAMRIKLLPEEIIELFPDLDITNKKLIALLSLMLFSRILDEFIYEVYRPKAVLRDGTLKDYEVEAFMNSKRMESPEVASWSINTVASVKSNLKGLCRTAGLTKLIKKGSDQVLFPLIDYRLANAMKRAGLDYELAALGGR